MSIARRWQRAVANGYRNWRYGTRERPANRLGVALAYLSPSARSLMDLEFRHLPRAWPGARVLDVGCGEGAFLHWAVKAGWEAVGVEPDPVAVAAARTRGVQVYQGTVDSVSSDASFDVVTASHVLEHVHDPRLLLERIRDLLKPGGLLWLDTPNLASLGHQRFGPAWLGLDPPRHLVLFDHRTLNDLLTSVGFTVTRRLPRPEVCKLTYVVSQRMASGNPNPLAGGAVPRRLRVDAYCASWRVRMAPKRSEFITLLARRTS